MPLLALATLPLAACATAASDAPNPRIVVICGTVVEYSKADMAKAADELAALPSGSVTGDILIPDLKRMRNEARACAKS